MSLHGMDSLRRFADPPVLQHRDERNARVVCGRLLTWDRPFLGQGEEYLPVGDVTVLTGVRPLIGMPRITKGPAAPATGGLGRAL
jgi:hypothetical protein